MISRLAPSGQARDAQRAAGSVGAARPLRCDWPLP